MSNENWTKGEWTVKEGHSPGIISVDCGGRMNITVVTSATDIDFKHGCEREANAHLIAAAPDLYEALKELSAGYTEQSYRATMKDSACHVGLDGGIDKCARCNRELRAIKALAKARGEL